MNKVLMLLLLSAGAVLHSSMLASEGARPTTTPAATASGENRSAATLATTGSEQDLDKALLSKILIELTNLKEKLNTFMRTQASMVKNPTKESPRA